MSDDVTPPEPAPLTYRDAGVDIDAGNRLVEAIKAAVDSTRRPEVVGELGGFGGLFAFPKGRYRRPLLVAGTDGVGTKLKLALAWNGHDGIGIDLVAMCVNDVLVCGAEPLFFLDYYATGKLDVEVARRVVEGIAAGCRAAGCALIGGETAEMPGFYAPGDYDLAGFCVGVVEADELIDGRDARPGDVLLGLPSSGPHANGYSLIRKILERDGARPEQPCGDRTLAEALLAPTRIYARAVAALKAAVPVKALAHITGGGLVENIPRVLPEDVVAELDARRWPRPPVFDLLAERGRLSWPEQIRTFNCGLGLVAAIGAEHVEAALAALEAVGETAWPVGALRARREGEARAVVHPPA
ncbi:MAG: phosphoribosylformylglycinamidine cyclo-ligase [Gammaproteobacteria bacterium]|nr:MAG: phosphoribosylformylglycinamidine cyclo-ligase [Gammaproteobacteria bacterium]